jgi:hypothetical protein
VDTIELIRSEQAGGFKGVAKCERQAQGLWSIKPAERNKVELIIDGNRTQFEIEDFGCKMETPFVKGKTPITLTYKQSIPKSNYGYDIKELREIALNDLNMVVTAQHSVLKGGESMREYPENLLKPGNDDWNKWCCQKKRSWVLLESIGDINMHFIRGIGFKSGPDKPRRDPDVAEIYIFTQKGIWIHS